MAVRDSMERELVLPPVTRRQSRSIKAESLSKVVGQALSDYGPLGMSFYAPDVEIQEVHDSIVGDTVLLGV